MTLVESLRLEIQKRRPKGEIKITSFGLTGSMCRAEISQGRAKNVGIGYSEEEALNRLLSDIQYFDAELGPRLLGRMLDAAT